MAPVNHLSDATKLSLDWLSIGGALAAAIGWIPEATIALGFVWMLLRCVTSWQEYRLARLKLRKEMSDG